MTFKEKLQMEHPENVDEVWCGGCRNCPSTYGYEKRRDCVFGNNEEKCAKCWNREMPKTEEFIEPKCTFETEVENAYKQGLNDAWELAKQILYGIDKQLIEIFDKKVEPRFFDLTHKRDIINCHTPQEAKAKIEKWRESNKIEVGDVVLALNETLIVVTSIKENMIYGIDEQGLVSARLLFSDVKKAGKHIDLKAILEQIGE